MFTTWTSERRGLGSSMWPQAMCELRAGSCWALSVPPPPRRPNLMLQTPFLLTLKDLKLQRDSPGGCCPRATQTPHSEAPSLHSTYVNAFRCVLCVSLCGARIYSHICALCTNIDVACLPVSLATCVWFSVSH